MEHPGLAGRRLLRAGGLQRLHAVPSGRRPRDVGTPGPRRWAALGLLAGQPRQHAGESAPRPGGRVRRAAHVRSRTAPARFDPGHQVGQADLDPERHPDQMVGRPAAARRHRAAAQGLRRASEHLLSGALRTVALLARCAVRVHARLGAAGGFNDARCGWRRSTPGRTSRARARSRAAARGSPGTSSTSRGPRPISRG